jgi:acetyl-CoA carboxylase biotin carboxyl carrier protein
MNSEEIQRLVEIVEKSDITELEVTSWGRKVRITKYAHNSTLNGQGAVQQFAIPATLPTPQPTALPLEKPGAQPPITESPVEKPAVKGEEMKSPMVGTFYRAPAPDAEPYVKVGDTVKEGQVLCIIEAMKLMNEVEAEFPCKILEVLIENSQPVEYNQPLFLVEKI